MVKSRRSMSYRQRTGQSDDPKGHIPGGKSMVLICIALYALAMAGVSFVAHQIVGNFRWFGRLVTIAAMYGAGAILETECRSP
jgi:hypothetical protein